MEQNKSEEKFEEIDDKIEENETEEQLDEYNTGYQKFLANIFFLNNLSDHISDQKYSTQPKITQSRDTEILLNKNFPILDCLNQEEQRNIMQVKTETDFFKLLNQNRDKFEFSSAQETPGFHKNRPIPKIANELNNLELDIDFGTYDFQRKFYSKYILISQSKVRNETEKSEQIKIKVQISDQNTIKITRARLDILISEFKQIYTSFCKLRCFLTSHCLKNFDSIFEFSDFALMQEVVFESFELVEHDCDFEIKWKRHKISEFYVPDINYTEQSFYKNVIFGYFKRNIFDAFQSLIDGESVTDEKILAYIIRQHHCFFEYMLKYEKQNKEGQLQELNKKA